MRFEFFVATRYLRAKRRQAVIGIITGISIAGVAAGVASLIVALSINNGFRQDLQDRLLGSTSHVNLLRIESDGIKDWRPLMDRLSKQPHVVATAPAVYEQVLISRGARARGAVLKGMIPAYERKVSDLLRSVNIGSADALEEEPPAGRNAGTASEPGSAADASPSAASPSEPQDSMRAVQNRLSAMPPIILGKDMAENLGATVGSVVLVTSPQGELTPFGMVPKYNRFRVAGIFNSGFYDYDSSWAFARLSDTQRLFGIGDQVSVIEFKLDDIYQAGPISQQLERAAGPGFMATNWMEQNKAIFRALRLERLVTFITIGLIVFVAALNILIALTMMVMEKTRDIAVLMSMGTRKSQVRRVFIAQGVLIGLIGTAIGLILGYSLSWAGGHYHFLSLSPEVYSIDYVPFVPRALDGVLVAAVAVGISFIATVYPSWAAARILPAEALRYE
ncbi:MAG: permease [Acidobacteria bacterium]|jgi:lipoprotein-releasing system permease protein|nr:MAG: permease [Chloroflexi bacterium 13_1_40CM_55_7]OLD15527.1 MAG: permease [Acidobacteriales bacterium 13_1_40CM_3_55_5]PYX03932.1 MAG: permease [Acidobacteriota bacterium]